MEKKVLGREKQFQVDQPDHDSQEPAEEPIECPNYHETIPGNQVAAHTVQCYRNSTKCKVCGEVILKSKKKEHLEKLRDQQVITNSLSYHEC